MAHNRDALMDAADRLAQQLKGISDNELQKIQRYFIRHKDWAEILRLLNQRVPRSEKDWAGMKQVLSRYNAREYSNDELSLILGWAARLLRYYKPGRGGERTR